MNSTDIINKKELREELGPRVRLVLWGLGALALCLGLAACGGTRYQPSGSSSDEETGSVVAPPPDVAALESAPGAPTAGVSRPVSRMPKAGTRGGQSRLVRVKVRRGDSLWTLARRKDVYGSGWLYPLLYKANRALIPDPQRLNPGIVLKIPRDVAAFEVEKAEEEAMTGRYLDRSPLHARRLSQGTIALAVHYPASAPVAPIADPEGPKAGTLGWTAAFLLLVALGVWIFMRLAKDDPGNGG